MSRPDDGIKVIYFLKYVRRQNPFTLEAFKSTYNLNTMMTQINYLRYN